MPASVKASRPTALMVALAISSSEPDPATAPQVRLTMSPTEFSVDAKADVEASNGLTWALALPKPEPPDTLVSNRDRTLTDMPLIMKTALSAQPTVFSGSVCEMAVRGNETYSGVICFPILVVEPRGFIDVVAHQSQFDDFACQRES